MPAGPGAPRRRSLALLVLLVAGLLVAAASPATAARFRPSPGTVVVRDAISPSNHVSFYVPATAAVGPREIAAAAAAAGLTNEGVEERDPRQPGVRELRLRTTVSTRTSWLSRRIDGRALHRLDVLGEGRLVLQLHPWATVTAGEVRPLEADLLPAATSSRATPTSTGASRRPRWRGRCWCCWRWPWCRSRSCGRMRPR